MADEIFISGIGGQGVQLIGKTLALAAIGSGKQVMLSGEYGGHMRGGSTIATLVIGEGRLTALPIVPEAGFAVALSHKFWDRVGSRLRPGALVLADTSCADDLPDMEAHRVARVDAAGIAAEAGSRMATGMAILGAFAGLTGIVSPDALVKAMAAQIPSYRSQHIPVNEAAIRAGAAAIADRQEALA